MTDHLDLLRTAFGGLAWPTVPPDAGAAHVALQFQLDRTQWWPPGDIRKAQYEQLALLMRHAYETVPHYRERLEAARYSAGMKITPEWFATLPVLTRADVHARGAELLSSSVPAAHKPVEQGQTSGSTGTPITYHTTAVTRLFWQAFNLRDQLWHRRDLSLRFAAIRPDLGARNQPGGMALPDWGPSIASAFRTGRAAMLHSGNTLDYQLAWLEEQDPGYVLTLASNLLELAREMRRRGMRLTSLREARTYGDALSAEARAECQALLGVKVVDMYTSQEAGYVALQCPDHDHYHVQSEGLMVEIVDDRNQPCPPGALGRVVLTTLHNYAMPLIRYDIGDRAEAGAPCPCGRGLAVIARILGRERNLALTPDGRKYYPSFAAEKWMNIAPIRQLQLAQKTLSHIEVRVASARALDAGEESRLAAALRQSLGHPYELAFVYLPAIPRSASGKYEDFVREVEA